jgi:hypothetical protein
MGDWVNLKTDTHAKGERYSSFKCQCGGTAKVKAVLTGENRVLFSNLAGVHVAIDARYLQLTTVRVYKTFCRSTPTAVSLMCLTICSRTAKEPLSTKTHPATFSTTRSERMYGAIKRNAVWRVKVCLRHIAVSARSSNPGGRSEL